MVSSFFLERMHGASAAEPQQSLFHILWPQTLTNQKRKK
jgi:hypothetical protein